MQQTLSREDQRPPDYFGTEAAIHGNTLVVGAPASFAPGAALVYTRAAGSWTLQAELSASEPAVDDSFGASVALFGDLLAVGAPDDGDSGSVYVFERTGVSWSLALRLEATGRTPGDNFGDSISVGADTILVGADADSERGENAGAAYLFVRDGSSWLQAQRLTAWDEGPAERDFFGTSVVLTETRAAVAAAGLGPDDAGSVFTYLRDDGATLSNGVMLRAADTVRFDRFGSSLAMSGDTIAVGAPGHSLEGSSYEDGAVYTFRHAAGTWVEEPVTPRDVPVATYFGNEVAIDNDILAVSAAFEGTGAVHLFAREGGAWHELQGLTDTDGLPTMGIEAAISVSGRSIAVGFVEGAYYGGQVAVLALSNGVSCTDDAGCSSGFCSEGLCCNDRCDNLCLSCRAERNSGGSDGTCGPVTAATDPRGACAEEAVATCGTTGACDGTGACKKHPVGSYCAPASCVGAAAETPAAMCSASGVCVQNPTKPCDGFLCTAGGCLTTCANDSACDRDKGFTCQNGDCSLPRGALCSRPDDCSDGHCVDGVCCDADCSGECEACTAELKGSGIDGECGAIAAHSDPDDECADDGPDAPCDADGTCDGRGNCRAFAPSGTSCGAATCAGARVESWTCDGEGGCDVRHEQCAGHCADGTCSLDCQTDNDCAEGALCTSEKQCEAKHAPGARCSNARECESNHCVDGVCCSSECSGQCEACNLDRANGTCSPVVSGNACQVSGCRGDRTAQVGTCDGTGQCQCPEEPRCSADGTRDGDGNHCKSYRCDADTAACLRTCKTSADCQPPSACNPANRECEEVHVLTNRTGGCSTSGRSTPPIHAFAIILSGLAIHAGRRVLRRQKLQPNPRQCSESSR